MNICTKCNVDGCGRHPVARGWCDKHYRRWKKHGDPSKTTKRRYSTTDTCDVESCSRTPTQVGFCGAHYSRFRLYGDPIGTAPIRMAKSDGPCTIAGCDGKYYARGWCEMHYARWRTHGDPSTSLVGPRGEGWVDKAGYRLHSVNGKAVRAHRTVMRNAIGRPLLPGETVHHINGDKLDNRIENLELWSSNHPSGQRVEDKTAWAIEWLRTYQPDALAETV